MSVFADRRIKLGVALILTFASGLVDIVGYLGVFHFFTAHLTGTTVQFGLSLIERNKVGIATAAAILAAFALGSIVGRAIIEVGSRTHVRRIASVTLALEALILLAALYGPLASLYQPYLNLSLLAGAMGLQTATLTGVGPLTVHTTFVTGMINKLAQLISHIAFRSYDLRHSKSGDLKAQHDQRLEIGMAIFLFAIWLLYVAGAVVGTLAFNAWKLHALFLAIALLLLAIGADQISPLSIEEEKEQSER